MANNDSNNKGGSRNGSEKNGKSKRGLASASKQTRERVARMGGEARGESENENSSDQPDQRGGDNSSENEE